jgi:hypothetical protein
MALRTTYIIAEGPQDAAVAGKILRKRIAQLNPISLRNEVDSFWDNLIPTTFPSLNTDDEPEFGRVRVPDFFQNSNSSVAIQTAGGLTQLVTMLCDDLKNLNQIPDSIGIIIDADNDEVNKTYSDVVAAIRAGRQDLNFHEHPGHLVAGPPKVGLFVLPNNSDRGTLEDTMLECAAFAYPQLLPIAETAVTSVSNSLAAEANWLKRPERDDFGKPFGPNKARVSVIGAILKPTYAISNTYRQHYWITEDTLQLPKLGMLTTFLTELVC